MSVYNNDYDVVLDDKADFIAMLEAITSSGLRMVNWITVGPGGGNHCITLRGDVNAHNSWCRNFYSAEEGVS